MTEFEIPVADVLCCADEMAAAIKGFVKAVPFTAPEMVFETAKMRLLPALDAYDETMRGERS